ncbi:DUF4169 family protein [Sulfitobacter mediterraneus]|uniref:DUF4169 family protein n=1 Tax=Sulfitobacter mediterraneus TaxID=83219 RepID=UPI001933F0F9|nr:DUF4169 family protein [Sulfitobacter mediterraneus]MBM1309083.1 DUF4169 family protein [Sulfitobacter mediterraneus]MBM1312967.1 DUF4169 family protein [Sulfitobacter mediterraneus]MBM1321351.1 DUF4169 family protein [Sulfitobacter mediterraneus]MBM1325238.1 DUF4169 family protein [Sulfitobacter mediterraneus]MBM1396585.1 DUF4169 family protein [Sulfitobacter mediterraneus]
MSTPINLNKVRKTRARVEKKARAEENSIKFGRSKAEKDGQKAAADKVVRFLDGHKRDP